MLRGGGVLANGASAVPSVETSLNAQIEDLVQRNRTLDHTNKKLVDELALEADRAKRASRDLQTKWQEDKHTWREGCNRLLSCHHLAHLRLNLKEMELCRQEKVARLHRDFQITMFRIRKGELDAKIEELEEELEEDLERHGRERGISSWRNESRLRRTKLVHWMMKGRLLRAPGGGGGFKLQQEHSQLRVSNESLASKVERMVLQIQGLESNNVELKRQNDELQRTADDVKRQLQQWQNLETKGGEEAEALRKKRISLEIEVKALEGRLEKKEGELQKEKAKTVKFKANVDEFEEHAEYQRQQAEEATAQLAKANRQIERLRKDLDAERAARPISPRKTRKTSPTISEDEVAQDFTEVPPPSSPPAKAASSKKPSSKINARASAKSGRNKPAAEMVAGPSNASDSEIEEVPDPRKRARAKAKAPEGDIDGLEKSRAPPRSKTVGTENSESEDSAKGPKKKGKAKAKAVEEDSDADPVQPEPARPKPAPRGKRKKDEHASTVNRAHSPELGDQGNSTKPRSKPGASSRAGSVQPRGIAVVSDDEADEPARKKKKRAIGIFPSNSQPTSFNFLATGNTAGGINIPTILSPVRESDNVPSRSTGSSSGLFKNLGGMLASSFTGRK
ncbi:hypothetical protein C8J57DRAFT_1462058 [Mycena rebaudengoi]|nr:hypothetical protein C8J57DRAFT_1462058 [Mycena rebaudengoi]